MLADYVDWRSQNPSDDLMTELLNAEVDEPDGSRRPLTRDEVVTYASMVAGAGNETATRLIGFTMQLLAQHPDQRRLLVEDPSLIPAAIEEILRLESPSPVQARYVQHDVEVHGTIVPEGSIMLLLNGAANRDERHWTDPDRFDVHRDEGAHLVVRLRAPLLPRRRPGAARGAGRAGGDPAALARVGRRHRPRADGPHRQRPRVGVPPRPIRSRGATMGSGRVRETSKRVVVWSTGGIGSLSIVAVNERPDLELVGVWVHSEDKVGRDAGELANGVPIGVTATNDVDALLALEPDCVIYAASGPERDAGAVPDYERILAAGVNVVTTTSTTLINPLAYVPAHRERLEAAARAGGASIYASGIEPGFLCDHLPIDLLDRLRSVSKVHCYEIALYDDYGVKEIMIDALGFGQPLDFEPWIMLPGAIAGEFEGQIRYIADGLGVEVDEVRETYDRRLDRTSRSRPPSAPSSPAPAARSASRRSASSTAARRSSSTTSPASPATSAPTGRSARPTSSYRIVLEGKPNFDCWVTPTLDDPAEAGIPTMGSGAGAMLATAMRVVNAVPYVVDAEPGLLRVARDAAHRSPRNAFRRLSGCSRCDSTCGRPTGGPASRTSTPRPSRCAAWAEDRGALVAVLSEHHGTEDRHLPSPLILASAIAARTERLPILLAAAVLPFYDPVRLAEDMSRPRHHQPGPGRVRARHRASTRGVRALRSRAERPRARADDQLRSCSSCCPGTR